MLRQPLLCLEMPARAAEAAPLRAALRAAIGPLLDEERLGDLALAATEAFANVVRHAYPAGVAGTCRVELHHHADAVELVVEDAGTGFDPSWCERVIEADESGRGFLLVRALVDELRCSRSTSGGARLSMRTRLAAASVTDVHRLHDRGPMRAVVSNPSVEQIQLEERKAATRRASSGEAVPGGAGAARG